MTLYTIEIEVCGQIRRWKFKTNGDDQFEIPIQDEPIDCTPDQDDAIRQHLNSFRRLVHTFGPENIQKSEFTKA